MLVQSGFSACPMGLGMGLRWLRPSTLGCSRRGCRAQGFSTNSPGEVHGLARQKDQHDRLPVMCGRLRLPIPRFNNLPPKSRCPHRTLGVPWPWPARLGHTVFRASKSRTPTCVACYVAAAIRLLPGASGLAGCRTGLKQRFT